MTVCYAHSTEFSIQFFKNRIAKRKKIVARAQLNRSGGRLRHYARVVTRVIVHSITREKRVFFPTQFSRPSDQPSLLRSQKQNGYRQQNARWHLLSPRVTYLLWFDGQFHRCATIKPFSKSRPSVVGTTVCNRNGYNGWHLFAEYP